MRKSKLEESEYQKFYSGLPNRRKATIMREAVRSKLAAKFLKNLFVPRCERCGQVGLVHRKKNGQKGFIGLEVAHLDQKALNNDIGNVSILCRPCHLLFDRGKRIYKKIRDNG